jgi:hypothetical protein
MDRFPALRTTSRAFCTTLANHFRHCTHLVRVVPLLSTNVAAGLTVLQGAQYLAPVSAAFCRCIALCATAYSPLVAPACWQWQQKASPCPAPVLCYSKGNHQVVPTPNQQPEAKINVHHRQAPAWKSWCGREYSHRSQNPYLSGCSRLSACTRVYIL